MAIERTVAEAIEKAEPTLELWERVCSELDRGTPWEKIDHGLRGKRWGVTAWEAYMRQRMYHHLKGIALCYRHGPDFQAEAAANIVRK